MALPMLQPLCLDDAALSALLREDVPYGDLTTWALGIGERPGVIGMHARGPQVATGTEEAARLLELCGATVDEVLSSGTPAPDGTPLLRAHGPAAALHRGWKVAQTLMEYAAGIATATRAIVAAVQREGVGGPAPVIACTRKTFPGTKALAVKAVQAGGGVMHRLGLSETVLVFPEHRAFLLGPEREAYMTTLRRHCPERAVVVEAAAIDEARAAALAGCDVVQLEKFPPEDVLAFVTWLRQKGLPAKVAAAGGVNAANAAAYAGAGADVLVTSAPYFAPPRDVAVTLELAALRRRLGGGGTVRPRRWRRPE